MKPKYRLWIRRLQAGVMGAISGSVISLLARFWDQIREIPWQFNAGYLLLSMMLVVAGIIGWGIVWSWMLRKLGREHIPLRRAVSVYLYANVARYVPGSVWNYFARVYLGQRSGIGARRVWTASLIEIDVSICTGLILYTASLRLPHLHHPFLPELSAGILIVVLLAIISPPVLRLLETLVGRLRKDELSSHRSVTLHWGNFIGFIGLSCAVWLLIGVAFYYLMKSIYPLPFDHLPEAIGVWSFSVIVGLVAIGIPQGLGVKEGVLIVALSTVVPLPVALSTSVLSRVWLVFCEVIALSAWWLTDTILSRRDNETNKKLGNF